MITRSSPGSTPHDPLCSGMRVFLFSRLTTLSAPREDVLSSLCRSILPGCYPHERLAIVIILLKQRNNHYFLPQLLIGQVEAHQIRRPLGNKGRSSPIFARPWPRSRCFAPAILAYISCDRIFFRRQLVTLFGNNAETNQSLAFTHVRAAHRRHRELDPLLDRHNPAYPRSAYSCPESAWPRRPRCGQR